MDKYRQNTESFLRAAAQSGDQEGIYAAYDFYRNGALVPPDLVQAYQYAAQFARAFPGDQAQVMMARVVKKMSPDELRRARGY
jgi:TPR repeat protein